MTSILMSNRNFQLQARLGLECGGAKQSDICPGQWAVGSGEPIRLQSRRVTRSELGSWEKKLAGRPVERRAWRLGTYRAEVIQA